MKYLKMIWLFFFPPKKKIEKETVIIVPEYETTPFDLEVAKLINLHRLEAGLNSLVGNDDACDVAAVHAKHMAATGEASHEGFESRAAYFSKTGASECVGYGYSTPRGFVGALKRSKAHNSILLGEGAVSIGVANSVDDKGTIYLEILILNA